MAHLEKTMAGVAASSHDDKVIPEWRLEVKRKERAERVRRAVGTIAAGSHDQEASVS